MGVFVKVVVSVVIIGLMLVGFWVVMYQPKQNEIAALEEEVQKENQRLQELQKEAENLAKWEQARVEFQNVLEKLHQTGSMKNFIPSFLTDIERLAKDERVSTNDPSFRVTSIQPGAVVQQAPQPTGKEEKKEGEKSESTAPPPAPVSSGKTVVQLNLNGRFNTIVDFLQQLGNFKLNKLVTIQRITLSPGPTPGPGLSPTLTVTMPFEVYALGGGG